MVSFMKQYENQTYALLRIVSGFAFLSHGAQKLMNFGDLPARMAYVAMPIELVGGGGSRILAWAFQCRELSADHEQG
jgi:putative oxidoreductase